MSYKNNCNNNLTIKKAQKNIKQYLNKPLKSFLQPNTDYNDFIKNKGKFGQTLELLLGKSLDNKHLDFVDGELKTYKSDSFGYQKETIAITMISNKNIDDLISQKPFKKSFLYTKIKKTLFVGAYKDDSPENWKFVNAILVNLKKDKKLRKILKEDYKKICKDIITAVKNGDSLHTFSGTFLQIRSKDSGSYHPIHSKLFNRTISKKSYAFYFKKEFIKYLINRMS